MVAAVVIIAATVAAMWPVTCCKFTLRDDDLTIFRNPLMRPPGLRTLYRYLTWPAMSLYTPVTYTVWTAVAAVSQEPGDELGAPPDLKPAPFHTVNLLFHLGGAYSSG